MFLRSKSKFFSKFFIFCLLFPTLSHSTDKCLQSFKGSLRHAQNTVSNKSFNYLPQFKNVQEEIELSKHWKREPVKDMKTLMNFLPKDVSFIDHALRESPSKNLIKFKDKGHSIILRAGYESQGKTLETNVTLSDFGLINNPSQSQKWLIDHHVPAGILFLHGGGTKSTGGHVAHSLINHFRKYNIAVLSPDLPWHAEGPRTIMGDLNQEIEALSDFVKKYVHPKVPLFIWGHSWGGSLSHRIMQMTGNEQEKGFFHPNLTGLIITSPAIDPAPGVSIKKKKISYIQRRESVFNEKQDQISPHDKDIFTGMVLDGKTSPVGEFFSSLTISQLNDQIPSHKGKKYLPALMIVGKGDPLVYVGFEDLFHNYYDNLENVETHYLENLPLLQNSKEIQKVGHLLSDYVAHPQDSTPINFKLSADFIARLVPELKQDLKNISKTPLLSILNLYSNDLAFREWLKETIIIEVKKNTNVFKKLQEERVKLIQKFEELIVNFHPYVWLFNELKRKIEEPEFSGQAKLNEIDQHKKQLKRFESFIQHASYSKFLLEIESMTDSAEVKKAIQTLLKKNILLPQLGSKSKKAFLREANSFSNNWPDFFNKFFYLTKEQQNQIQSLYRQIKDNQDKINEVYIPSKKEFENLNLNDRRLKDKIRNITYNVKKRKELNEQESKLNNEKNKLKKELNKNLIEILKSMRQVREVLESASLSPPEHLKNLFLESAKEFDELYKLSRSLGDKIEADAIKSIEKKDFTLNTIECCMNNHSEEINLFNAKYNNFILNRKKIRKKLIESAKNGSLTQKETDIFNSLYGNLSLYKLTDTLSIEMAQKEAELLEVTLKKIQYLENYQKLLLPYQPLSIISISFPKNILNNHFDINNANNYNEAFQQILKNWNSLGSFILPPLPE